jgi:hypothetical protein
MVIKYENVVPWGRSYQEYIRMFDIAEADLSKKILGCGDGPASFNSIMHKNGKQVVSIDPVYQSSREEIERRIKETYDNVISQTKNNRDKFIWETIKSIDELGAIRMAAMKEFLADYDRGKDEGRYIYGELPELPFADNTFDLVLCSHFLFLYSDNLSLDFHVQAIREMCRAGKETRIFPIVDVNSKRSVHIDPLKEYIQRMGWTAQEIKVDYEFQKNGNTMLKLKNNN